MTTYDFWVSALDGGLGAALSRSGREENAHHLGWTLWEFFGDGRATCAPGGHVTHFTTVLTGDVLAEVFRETERHQGCVFRQVDRARTVEVIDPAHHYAITFIEH